jgi:hypothetical protein
MSISLAIFRVFCSNFLKLIIFFNCFNMKELDREPKISTINDRFYMRGIFVPNLLYLNSKPPLQYFFAIL